MPGECSGIVFLALLSVHFRESLPPSTLDIITSRQSDVASCMFPSVKGRDCKIANCCLDWKDLPVQSSEAFLEGPSLVFHGHRCSHVVLCSCLIECSWGNSLVDFLIMPPLLPLPWFCLVLIFIHCAGLWGDYISPEVLYIFMDFDPSCIFPVCPPHTFSLFGFIFHSPFLSLVLSLVPCRSISHYALVFWCRHPGHTERA